MKHLVPINRVIGRNFRTKHIQAGATRPMLARPKRGTEEVQQPTSPFPVMAQNGQAVGHSVLSALGGKADLPD
jgi:hypothetical protein